MDEDDTYDSDDHSDEGFMQEQPRAEEIRNGTDVEFNDTLQKIIDEAGNISKNGKVNDEVSTDDDTDLQQDVDDIPKTSTHRTVWGDIFHFMDRAKLLMHHE